MDIYLLDGTYELFRHFFAVPSQRDAEGYEIGAVRGVLASVVGMLEEGVRHLGVATDHVVESFRNELWVGYKTGEGIYPMLFAQFRPLEEALEALGVVVWPMTDLEADDALASAAAKASGDPRVEQVFICTPDKDLAQCVTGQRVVQFDRRAGALRDDAAVLAKFGVPPGSIPDYLALVSDTADGFTGLRRWGAKSTALVLGRYLHLEAIPDDAAAWDVEVRGASRLAAELATHRDLAVRFRDLATLRTTASVFETVDDLLWTGPRPVFFEVCARLNTAGFYTRAQALARAL